MQLLLPVFYIHYSKSNEQKDIISNQIKIYDPISYNYYMKPDIAKRLNRLNRQFYTDFAQQFSSTRLRLQPGVERIIAQLPFNASILDLGCGNGELCLQLYKRGFNGDYVGIDFSPDLVNIASKRWLD